VAVTACQDRHETPGTHLGRPHRPRIMPRTAAKGREPRRPRSARPRIHRVERRAAAYDRGVSTAYAPEEWKDLFVAMAGAAAALAGLLFVAVSINVDRIVKYEGLPERGLEALGLLLAALIVSIAGLMPGQGHVAFGLELIGITAALIGLLFAIPVSLGQFPEGVEAPSYYFSSRWAIRLSGPLLLAIGAVSELLAAGGGLYWVAAGFVFLTLGAVANAWVLLIEILR
jgi:hypothetical protein